MCWPDDFAGWLAFPLICLPVFLCLRSQTCVSQLHSPHPSLGQCALPLPDLAAVHGKPMRMPPYPRPIRLRSSGFISLPVFACLLDALARWLFPKQVACAGFWHGRMCPPRSLSLLPWLFFLDMCMCLLFFLYQTFVCRFGSVFRLSDLDLWLDVGPSWVNICSAVLLSDFLWPVCALHLLATFSNWNWLVLCIVFQPQSIYFLVSVAWFAAALLALTGYWFLRWSLNIEDWIYLALGNFRTAPKIGPVVDVDLFLLWLFASIPFVCARLGIWIAIGLVSSLWISRAPICRCRTVVEDAPPPQVQHTIHASHSLRLQQLLHAPFALRLHQRLMLLLHPVRSDRGPAHSPLPAASATGSARASSAPVTNPSTPRGKAQHLSDMLQLQSLMLTMSHESDWLKKGGRKATEIHQFAAWTHFAAYRKETFWPVKTKEASNRWTHGQNRSFPIQSHRTLRRCITSWVGGCFRWTPCSFSPTCLFLRMATSCHWAT